MPCFHPIRGVLCGPPNKKIVVFSANAHGKGIILPCGRCIGCRIERARQWAVRMMHEAESHADNSFITLTYDEDFLPANGSISSEAMQLFMKRLRSRISPIKIKFFLCGEYGEVCRRCGLSRVKCSCPFFLPSIGRPHYHAIIFGYDFPDKVPLKMRGGFQMYRSDLLEEVWSFGFSEIGEVSFDSACYVANYATKKITNKEARFDGKTEFWPSAADHYGGRTPEFVHMSRGGRDGNGIGHDWISRFKSDVYPSDEVIVNEHQAKPPRYYDKYIEGTDMATFEKVMLSREAALEEVEAYSIKGKVFKVLPATNPYRLAVRERCATAKLSQKCRNLEKPNA